MNQVALGTGHPDEGAPTAMPVHRAEALVGPDGIARIVLDGQVYTLRVTRARKLILTK